MGLFAHSSVAVYGSWSNATLQLALACIGVDIALVSPGPFGESESAMLGFLLVPIGGLPAFCAGLSSLMTRPATRFARAQVLVGALALGIPGIVSAVAMADTGHVNMWRFSIPWLFAPLTGWALLVRGLAMIRHAMRRGTTLVMTGGLLLSLPWLFGLFVLYYVTYVDD